MPLLEEIAFGIGMARKQNTGRNETSQTKSPYKRCERKQHSTAREPGWCAHDDVKVHPAMASLRQLLTMPYHSVYRCLPTCRKLRSLPPPAWLHSPSLRVKSPRRNRALEPAKLLAKASRPLRNVSRSFASANHRLGNCNAPIVSADSAVCTAASYEVSEAQKTLLVLPRTEKGSSTSFLELLAGGRFGFRSGLCCLYGDVTVLFFVFFCGLFGCLFVLLLFGSLNLIGLVMTPLDCLSGPSLADFLVHPFPQDGHN